MAHQAIDTGGEDTTAPVSSNPTAGRAYPAVPLDALAELARATTVESVVRAFSAIIAAVDGADLVVLGLLHSHDAEMVDLRTIVGDQGSMHDTTTAPLRDLASSACLTERGTFAFDPSDRSELDANVARANAIETVVAVPVRFEQRDRGIMSIGSVAEPIESGAADALAQLVAAAFERVDARNRLQRELGARVDDSRRWELLRQLELRLAASSRAADVIEAIAVITGQLISGASALFIELDGDHGVVHNFDERIPAQHVGASETAIVRSWLGAGVAHYVADLNESATLGGVPGLSDDARSLLSMGIRGARGPVGAIIITAPVAHAFGARDRQMLIAASSMVANALERIDADQQLQHSTGHDQLTGLIRRDRFEELLEAELVRLSGGGKTSAVVSLDADRFKLVNDAEGFLGGDSFLVELTARLQRILGPSDDATRVGADEFAILLRDRTPDQLTDVCEEIVQSVASVPFIVGSRSIAGTVSVGFTVIDSATVSAQEAMSQADAACYAAKLQGGNAAFPASRNDARQSARRNASRQLTQLRRALDDETLTLLAQPIYELQGLTLSGLEVLIRMQDEEGGLIPPSQFLPIAERYHVIDTLDSWVVERALERFVDAPDIDANNVTLFLNLSPSSITSSGFADRIEAIVNNCGVDPNRICFEITETGTMKSFDEALAFIKRISAMGARVALDDFGVGLSSLSHLQQLPVDVLKIDGSLVLGIESNPLNATMVSTIEAMAQALGLTTIAEFVETDAALKALQAIGIHCAQGFHLGTLDRLETQLAQAAQQITR